MQYAPKLYKKNKHCQKEIGKNTQVYSILYSLQQFVVTYKSLTNQCAINQLMSNYTLDLTVCCSTNQRAFTIFALLLRQSVSYYTFLHCLHVQEKLMELDY